MKKPKITKAEAMPLAAMAIVFICYAAETSRKEKRIVNLHEFNA